MSGIYIHIPFASRHVITVIFIFSTSMKKKEEMVMAIAKEQIKASLKRNKLRPFILVEERQVFEF
jgi:hypothetical protein